MSTRQSKLLCILVLLSVIFGTISNLFACTELPEAIISYVEIYYPQITPYLEDAYKNANGEYFVAVDQTVVFTIDVIDSDNHPTIMYDLDYGDGSNSVGDFIFDTDDYDPVELHHSFGSVGTYTVKLEVDDGFIPDTDTILVHVGPRRVERLAYGTTDTFLYSHIQHAIDQAGNGDRITANEGVYVENIDFNGKGITVKSESPDNPANTVIVGDSINPVVSFNGEEGKGTNECQLSGFTITDDLPDNGLVVHLKFDESGSTTTFEVSPGDYVGNIIGAPSWEPLRGFIDGALSFDGVDNHYATITGYKGITGNAARTVSAWIKATTDGQGHIVHWGDLEADGNRWSIFLNHSTWIGNLGVIRVAVQGGTIVGTSDLRDNKWHHVAATYKQDDSVDDIKLYVDGVPEAIDDVIDSVVNTAATTDVAIGELPGGNSFKGLIDDVRIYNRALDEIEINKLALSRVAPNPVLYLKLNDNILDSSPSGVNTELHGINTTPWESQGKINTALEFNGADTYIFTDSVLNPSLTPFSAFVWVKGGTTYDKIFAQEDEELPGTGTGSIWLQTNSLGQLASMFNIGGSVNLVSTYTSHTDGNWHHVGFIWDGKRRYIYADGVVVKSDTDDLTGIIGSCTGNMCIGVDLSFTSYTYWNGLMDEVRIYDQALSNAEVIRLYETTSDKFVYNGGGIYGNSNNETTGTNATISKCVITGNKAENGGGIYDCDGEISNCTITNNTADADGGGLANCDGTIINCLVAGNSADDGGAIIGSNDGNILNFTVVDNIALTGTGGIKNCTSYIANCIIWGNDDDMDGARADYSCIEDHDVGSNNIYLDPEFIVDDPLYHISWNSPCIDRGILNLDYTDQVDIDGESRSSVTRVDIGADEASDLDGDGMLDSWEVFYGLDDPAGNEDAAGEGLYPLTNLEEFLLGTDPTDWDTDNDGLSDGWEYANGLDPTNSSNSDAADDLDGDGKSNIDEYSAVPPTDPLKNGKAGLIIEYTYGDNTSNQIVTQTIKNGAEETISVTEYEYDEMGRKKKQQRWKDAGASDQAEDAVTLYKYDVRGNLLWTTQKTENSVVNNDTIEITGTDIITKNDYDIYGRIDSVTDPKGNVTDYEYTDGGDLDYVLSPSETGSGIIKTTNVYDLYTGRLESVVDGRNNYTKMTYDSLGRIVKEMSFDSSNTAIMQTRFEYDGMNNVTRQAVMAVAGSDGPIENEDDMVTDSSYDSWSGNYPGLLSSVTMYYGGSPEISATTWYAYDGLGRLTDTTDPANNTVVLVYDDMNRVETRTEISHNPDSTESDIVMTTGYEYDSLGRVWKQTEKPDLADPSTWQTTVINYDAAGKVLAVFKPDGVLTTSAYNGLGQLTKQIRDAATGGIAQTTDYYYYRIGLLNTVIASADGTTPQTTTYTYYPDGQIDTVLYPDGYDETYDYYVNGNLKTKENKNDWQTLYIYDNSGNVTSKTITKYGAPTVVESFGYDALNRLKTASKTENTSPVSDTAFFYTAIGSIDHTTDSYFGGVAKTISYEYDQAGYLTNTIYPDLTEIVRTPTWDGQIGTLSKNSDLLVSYDYIGGKVASRDYNDIGVNLDSAYDNLGRLSSQRTYPTASPETNIAAFTYDYTPKRNDIETIHSYHRPEWPNNRFAYDALGRLDRADYGVESTYEAFTMDKLGNRDEVDIWGFNVDYAIDVYTNRYTAINSLVPNQAYDNAGNLLASTSDGVVYYVNYYDHENRIVKNAKSGPADLATYTYDALGRRIESVDLSASPTPKTTRYYYSANWQVLSEYDDSYVLQRRFVYGNYIDEVLLMTDAGGYDHYYVHDHLYSPVALLEDVGSSFNIIERYEYDAYGYVTMFDGDFTPITGSAASNPYYFTGRRLDLMDGGNYELMYYRNRTYDPQTGRFLQLDPLGYIDGMNLYEYVGSNPVMAVDPMGLSSLYQETFPIWDRYRFENGYIGGPLGISETKANQMARYHSNYMKSQYGGSNSTYSYPGFGADVGSAVGMGLVQGGLNGVNSLQDVATDLANIPVHVYNLGVWAQQESARLNANLYPQLYGYNPNDWKPYYCSCIPKWDWSKDKAMRESDIGHKASKIMFGEGAMFATGAWVGKCSKAAKAGNLVDDAGNLVDNVVGAVDDAAGLADDIASKIGDKAVKAEGQLHHGISKKVSRALNEHKNLKGLYSSRDPRFVTRAKDSLSHRGYQRWHIDLDDEVVNWIKRFDDATPDEFEKFLMDRYRASDLIEHFPNGLKKK